MILPQFLENGLPAERKTEEVKPKSFDAEENVLALIRELKENLTTTSISILPNREGKILIDTDACKK